MGNEDTNLKRSLNAFETLLITLSGITPCCSFFMLAPLAIQLAGNGAFLSFLGAAVIALCLALVYAELGSAFPFTGLEYAIAGRVLGPFAGFVVLGVSVVTFPLSTAAFSLSITRYLPAPFSGMSPVEAGLVSILFTTLVAILNVRTNSFITGIFLALELLAILVLSYFGFSRPGGSFSHLLLHPVQLGPNAVPRPASIEMIALAMPLALFAYNGYQGAVSFGEETNHAGRNIARIVLWTLMLAVVTECLPLAAVLLGSPDEKTLAGSPNMILDFVRARGGRSMAVVMGIAVALAQLNANIASILIFGRQVYSSGRDEAWTPGVNRLLTRIHKRFHSPWVATLFGGLLSAAGCFINLNTLLVITGSSMVFIYIAVCIAALVGRRNGSTSRAQYRMPLFPLVPLAALAGLGYVIYATYMDKDVGRPSLYASAAMVLVSVGYYFLILRRRGQWVLRGPGNEAAPMPVK